MILYQSCVVGIRSAFMDQRSRLFLALLGPARARRIYAASPNGSGFASRPPATIFCGGNTEPTGEARSVPAQAFAQRKTAASENQINFEIQNEAIQ